MGSEGIAGNLVVHLGGQAGGADGFGAGPGVNLALVDHLCARAPVAATGLDAAYDLSDLGHARELDRHRARW